MMHANTPPHPKKTPREEHPRRTEEDDFAITLKKTQTKKPPFSHRLVYRSSRTAMTARARGVSKAAKSPLVTHYEGQIFRLARRIVRELHDVEEVVQDTFLSVLDHLGDFRSDAPFRAWLMRIAANTALKLLRKRRSHATVPWEPDNTIPHPQFIAPWQKEIPELAGREEIRRLVDEAIAEFDEKYRVVFVLRDIHEMAIEEVAAVLQITPANVKVRLMRARLMLRSRSRQSRLRFALLCKTCYNLKDEQLP